MKHYQLNSAPASTVPPSIGRYWALWKQVEARKSVDRIRLTMRVLKCCPRVAEMSCDQLAKMIRVFEAMLRKPAADQLPSPGMLPHPPQLERGVEVNRDPSEEYAVAPTRRLENSGMVEAVEASRPPHETPATALHPERDQWSAAKQKQHTAYLALKASDPSLSDRACAQLLGLPVKSLWMLKEYASRGFASHRARSGAKPEYLPNSDELACVREIKLQLDDSVARGRGLGSSTIAAYRLAAKGDDPRISPQFKSVVLKQRATKRVPPSWMRLLDTTASVLDAHRDKRSTLATYICTPRHRTIVTADGQEIPLTCGSIFETDDGTLNFYAYIPWPFGGDPCSEKFGVKLGRWQFLPAVDVHSEMCVAFDVVARQAGSYRAEDSRAIIGRTMFEIEAPAMWRLERGAWESHLVRDALKLCNVPVFNAWHSKQKSAIERFFDRVWTPASLIPGHVGRDRDRYKQITNLALACQQGRRDPRDHFLSLAEALPKLVKAVEFANTEPVHSHSGWGSWLPQERWQQHVTERQPQPLPEKLAVYFAREQREGKVRKGLIGWNVRCPQVKFPVYFQTSELWEFEGCRIQAYFDPFTDPTLGTIVLREKTWRSYRDGHVIARNVRALDLPPQAVLSKEWSDPEREAQLANRKAMSAAVRTEMWNWRGGRQQIARDGFGNEARVQLNARAPAPELLKADTAHAGGVRAVPREVAPLAAPARTQDSVAALFGG